MTTIAPVLAPGELHVVSASLARSPCELAGLAALLSPDERDRAQRFALPRLRDRYVAGRGVLRTVLGAYAGRRPEALAFDYGEFGKPALRGGELEFNLSHSGDRALLAVTQVAQVGVDLELEPVSFDVEALAARFFSPGEVAALRALPGPDRPRAFLQCWTRKEAFVKARGDGLQLALDGFDVSLGPGIPAGLRRTAWSDQEPGQWTITDVSDDELGYVGAVAIRATTIRVVRHHLAGELHRFVTTQEDR